MGKWPHSSLSVTFFVFVNVGFIPLKHFAKPYFCDMIDMSDNTLTLWFVHSYPYAVISLVQTHPNAVIWLVQATYHSIH